jgi:hypothetical protein
MTAISSKCLSVLVALAVASLTGCGGAAKMQEAANRAKTQNDLRMIGLAFHNFSDANPGKAPAKAEDLKPYLNEAPEVYKKLETGEYVFVYNVSLTSMNAGAGGSSTVLAYEKDVPTKGGAVVMGDASTKQMTAEEFKAATKGK